jgi:hypothetical protein
MDGKQPDGTYLAAYDARRRQEAVVDVDADVATDAGALVAGEFDSANDAVWLFLDPNDATHT